MTLLMLNYITKGVKNQSQPFPTQKQRFSHYMHFPLMNWLSKDISWYADAFGWLIKYIIKIGKCTASTTIPESTNISCTLTRESHTLITKSSMSKIMLLVIPTGPTNVLSLHSKVPHYLFRTRQDQGKVRETGVHHQGSQGEEGGRNKGVYE